MRPARATRTAQATRSSPRAPERRTPPLLMLQRAAGNAQVARLVAVQRDPDTDLAGTPFDSFPDGLKTALRDPAKFPRPPGKTLAAALNEYSNLSIAALARTGSRIDAIDRSIWNAITKIPTKDQGAWATDNIGIPFGMDESAMKATCDGLTKAKDKSKMCKDNDPFITWVHPGATDAWRECVTGGAGLHIVLGKDIHVDYHQPSDGADDKGMCTTNTLELPGHEANYLAGAGGARSTPVARYAAAQSSTRSWVKNSLIDDSSRKALQDCIDQLDGISAEVTKYAAKGNYAPGANESAGDLEMAKRDDLMDVITKAENTVAGAKAAMVPDLF